MPFVLNPHVLDEATGTYHLKHPHMQFFSDEAESAIYLQAGKFYSHSGTEVESLPEWLNSQLAAMDEKTLATYGYKRPSTGRGK